VCFQDMHTQCRRRCLKRSREVQLGLSSIGLAQFEMKRTCLVGRRSAQPSHPPSKIQEAPRMAELLARSFREPSQATRGLRALSDSSGLVLAVFPASLGIHKMLPLCTRAHQQGGVGRVRRTGLPLANLSTVTSIRHTMAAFFFSPKGTRWRAGSQVINHTRSRSSYSVKVTKSSAKGFRHRNVATRLRFQRS
jgi:hypothetical protein